MSTLVTLYFNGDHLARTPFQPTNIKNPGEQGFGMQLRDVEPVGGPSDVYRLVWYQNTNSRDTTFRNGQMWRIEKYDPAADTDNDPMTGDAGWSRTPVFRNLIPKSDLVAGLGSGQDYIVFEDQGNGGGRHLILDMNRSFEPGRHNLFIPGPKTPDMTFGCVKLRPPPTCFLHGTMIDTPAGPRPVEALAPGDLVLTVGEGPRPILWAGTVRIGTVALRDAPFRPIRIAAGALGEGRPRADLVVSPQHRILLRSAVALEMFGTPEILVAAKQLLGVPGVSVEPGQAEVRYAHILLEDHGIVLANGAEAETMYLGAEAIKNLTPAGRREIEALFPDLASGACPPQLARPVPKGRAVRELTQRHVMQGQPLVQAGAAAAC